LHRFSRQTIDSSTTRTLIPLDRSFEFRKQAARGRRLQSSLFRVRSLSTIRAFIGRSSDESLNFPMRALKARLLLHSAERKLDVERD
jgi:hypothetical protein